MTEVTLRLSTATIEAFTAAYGEKHWQRKALQLLSRLCWHPRPQSRRANALGNAND
jgi:hypothetical protein